MKYISELFFCMLLLSIAPCFAGENQTPGKVARQEVDSSGGLDLSFSDGSNNLYSLKFHASESVCLLEYVPVKANESSSGVYSGGQAAKAELSQQELEQLRERLGILAAQKNDHLKNRTMGSGLFFVRNSAGENRFIYPNGKTLHEFIEFMKSLLDKGIK